MSQLERLLEKITPEDVLDRFGADYRITRGSRGEQVNLHECPFCGGRSWKVFVNRENGLGNCFHGSCGQTFNLYGLTRRLLGDAPHSGVMRFLETLERDLGLRPARTGEKQAGVDLEVEWRLPTSLPLPTRNGLNLDYLRERGVDDDLCREFHLRFCQAGWFEYVKPDGSRGGSDFSNRVIIPVFDLDGRLATFQGRDITGRAERKYLFPPGLPGTARFLYNGQNALGVRTAVLGEGAFDVIAIRRAIRGREQFGETVAIGSFGKHFSTGGDGDDQLAQILALKRRGLEEVRIAWDGEEKAWRAAADAAAILLRHGLKVALCRLPKGKDPAEVSPEELRQAITTALPVDQKRLIEVKLKNPYR